MQESPNLFASMAALAVLASIASYYLYQWLASCGWRTPLPYFVSGLAVALMLLGVGLSITEFLPLPQLGRENVFHDPTVGALSPAHVTRDHPSSWVQSAVTPRARSETRTHQDRGEGSRSDGQSGREVSQLGSRASERQSQPESLRTATSHQSWLEDLSFWGATKCVLAVRLDPEDAATWTLINDCEVDVAILVATCASALDECRQRQSRMWTYSPNGAFLPAKFKRSVSADEQTVHGLHLRYVACRTHPISVDPTKQDQSVALRQVGIESCEVEVRALSQEGVRSGLQIEELVNELVPSNPCCSRE